MIEGEFLDQIENNKNIRRVCCQYCNSLILKPKSASYIEQQHAIPLMQQEKSRQSIEIENEILTKFWTVEDMFTFENIGFSHTVNDTKFLVCADCESGPVGFYDIETKKSFIALQRVNHT